MSSTTFEDIYKEFNLATTHNKVNKAMSKRQKSINKYDLWKKTEEGIVYTSKCKKNHDKANKAGLILKKVKDGYEYEGVWFSTKEGLEEWVVRHKGI